MSETARLITAEELEKFPSDDNRYELVQGRIVPMSPVGYAHARIVLHFGAMLLQHIRAGGLGEVFTELGVTLARNPDTVRAPDIAFIRQDRIPATEPKGFWQGAPDLVVEVLSPDDRRSEVRAKVEEYLMGGVPVVLMIDPERSVVTVFRPSSSPIRVTAHDDVLDLDDVLPGFRCTTREIFEKSR